MGRVFAHEYSSRWNEFAEQLILLNDLRFDRRLLHLCSSQIELHGFCDASQKAYGACIYLRSVDSSGKVIISLYCSRSRVAPIKTPQTIPRLELCAAVLLAELYTIVRSAIKININRVFFWTDSIITLCWINTAPHLLKTFVANRVAQIRQKTEPEQWRHVRTCDNPADILSRGQLPANFLNQKFWPTGPK